MLEINLKQLESFVATVEHAGFTAAAAALYLTQSTVSAHVSALEQTLGVPLYPEDTSFSMIFALVAGVPSPFFSVSESNSLFPAVSIAASKVSSVNIFGGDV